MNRTKIPWALNPDGTQGYSSNPVKGKCPVGCSYCYAERIRIRFKRSECLTFYHQELTAIKRRRKPAGIFLGSAMELWHENTIGIMPEIMETIRACPQHRFYLLTKCPQNLIKYSPFPSNAWVGVTMADGYADSLVHFKQVKVNKKYISFEPLLKWADWADWGMIKKALLDAGINWVIIGAQTKPYKPPKIEWVEEIVKAADSAGISVFLKDNLRPLLFCKRHGMDVIESHNLWAVKHFKLRQEMPVGSK